MSSNKHQKNWLSATALLFFSQIAHADIPAAYSVIDTISYEYDEEGNRISRSATVSGVAETPIEAQYDQGNRLTQLTLKGQGQNGTDATCVLTYDPAGNLAEKACSDPSSTTPVTTQYIWDSRNHLTQIQSPGFSANFQYDPLGRRIERTVNGVTTHYLYDGNQAIAELSDSGSTNYLTGLAIDEVIARYTQEGERTLLADALGSVFIAAKEDASVATAYGYSAYGETQVMGTEEQNPVQYTSRENDGTGLYYYRARYYDPQLKRFISEDPINILGGINIYAYPFNPISGKDPLGLTAIYSDGNNSYSGFPPPGGVCMEAVWMGGYIVGWKPCKQSRPRPNNQICTPDYDDPSDDEPDGPSDDEPGIDPWDVAKGLAKDLITPDLTWLGGPIIGTLGKVGKFWKGLKGFRAGTKTNGLSGKDRRYYEWDHTHGDVEVYGANGRHMGSANPATGDIVKPPVPGRKIKL